MLSPPKPSSDRSTPPLPAQLPSHILQNSDSLPVHSRRIRKIESRKVPKKHAQDSPTADGRFVSWEAKSYYWDAKNTRGFTLQRGFDFSDPETEPLSVEVMRRGWMKLAEHPTEYSPTAVWEFFANLHGQLQRRKDRRDGSAIVSVQIRNVEVPFSSEAIRDFLEIPDVPIEQRSKSTTQLAPKLFCEALGASQDGWRHARVGSPIHYLARKLPHFYGAWNLFFHRSLEPSQQESRIRANKCTLLYDLAKGHYIDIPSIIYNNILYIARIKTYNLIFPQLITQMIRHAGVDVDTIGVVNVDHPPITVKNIRVQGGARSFPEQSLAEPEDEDGGIAADEEQLDSMDSKMVENLLFPLGTRRPQDIPGALARFLKKMAQFTEKLTNKMDEVVASKQALQAKQKELRLGHELLFAENAELKAEIARLRDRRY